MPDQPRRFGVIVGVSDFATGEQISPIPYANNDAARVYQLLRDSCGFNTEQLYLLASQKPESLDATNEAPTRPNILNALKYVADNAGANDLIFVFVASHGVEISTSPYLLTADTRMNVVKETAIDANEINDILESSSANCVIRVFDACRSPFGIARSTAGRMTDAFQQAMFTPATGWATISSCSSGEFSYESGDFEQGVFSHYLCEGILGKAANPDGNVTLESLVDYVKISVSNWGDSQTLKQTPHFRSDLSGVLLLSSTQTSVVGTQPVSAEHPLSQLQVGVRDELAATAADVRHLQFTSESGAADFSKLVFTATDQLVADFADATISISRSEAQPLHELAQGGWQQFSNEMNQLKVKPEFLDHPTATALTFTSNEVVVPNSTLIVATARFSFFYWLWYMHRCDVPKLQNRFQPQPAFRTGTMTFKSTAARDSDKVGAAVRETLSRAGQSVVDWTAQLRGFVDNRLNPLREQGTIIE